MNLIGYFGSYISTTEDGGVAAGTDLVDLIYEQECLRFPELNLERDKFRLVNVNLVCPPGTVVKLNGSDYCRILFTDTKMLVLPPEYAEAHSIIFETSSANVNCRYLY